MKKLIFLILLISVIACKKKDDTQPKGQPTKSSTIKLTLNNKAVPMDSSYFTLIEGGINVKIDSISCFIYQVIGKDTSWNPIINADTAISIEIFNNQKYPNLNFELYFTLDKSVISNGIDVVYDTLNTTTADTIFGATNYNPNNSPGVSTNMTLNITSVNSSYITGNMTAIDYSSGQPNPTPPVGHTQPYTKNISCSFKIKNPL